MTNCFSTTPIPDGQALDWGNTDTGLNFNESLVGLAVPEPPAWALFLPALLCVMFLRPPCELPSPDFATRGTQATSRDACRPSRFRLGEEPSGRRHRDGAVDRYQLIPSSVTQAAQPFTVLAEMGSAHKGSG
jgi:hypothetical protein